MGFGVTSEISRLVQRTRLVRRPRFARNREAFNAAAQWRPSTLRSQLREAPRPCPLRCLLLLGRAVPRHEYRPDARYAPPVPSVLTPSDRPPTSLGAAPRRVRVPDELARLRPENDMAAPPCIVAEGFVYRQHAPTWRTGRSADPTFGGQAGAMRCVLATPPTPKQVVVRDSNTMRRLLTTWSKGETSTSISGASSVLPFPHTRTRTRVWRTLNTLVSASQIKRWRCCDQSTATRTEPYY
jgi:hypothetical protein